MSEIEGVTQRKRPSGRRTGDSGTRDAILDAALTLFADQGYDGASIRAIAIEAGVDPALIRHFFGDKEALFAAVVTERSTAPQQLAEAFAGDPAQRGERVVDRYLRIWEHPESGQVLQALLRSASTSERAAAMLGEVLGSRVRTEHGKLPAADSAMEQQIAIAAAHLMGVAFARYIVKLPQITALSHDELVAEIAPTIQRYLNGENR